MAAATVIWEKLDKPHGHKKFCDIPDFNYNESCQSGIASKRERSDPSKVIAMIQSNIIGADASFSGPYGLRNVIYCDYTASGRSLHCIEDYIKNEVLPMYGNTHTTTSVTSLQTTLYRHEARAIIRNAVNASEHDAVIFVGSGCTAAVHKLIHALHLQSPPIVLVSPYEHHSNLLPWRELGAKVIRIKETVDGLVDLQDLEEQLKLHQTSSLQLIGCFSAASNITGILVDTDKISVCLHKYGALAFWDYATAAPYVQLDMNPVLIGDDQCLAYKDAIFISPHKFIGGVGTPGILVAKKKLFRNSVPSECGGGTVFYVSRESHRYLKEPEMREEGGTPAIVDSIRAGLVFQLKEAVTSSAIMEREHLLCQLALQFWNDVPNLILLGNSSVLRLPIFSFMIVHPESGFYLHYNFICSLLNDLFGIQARGGCACAGPYALDLLGINEELAGKYEDALVENEQLDRVHLRRYREYSEKEILRPGFARINLSYFASDEEISFVLKAVKLIAEEGWKLLPQYLFNPETGEWRHRLRQVFKERKWLQSVSYSNGYMIYPKPEVQSKGPLPKSYEECLHMAQCTFNEAEKIARRNPTTDQELFFNSEFVELRWFLLPSEAQLFFNKIGHCPPFKNPPFLITSKKILKEEISQISDNSISSLTERFLELPDYDNLVWYENSHNLPCVSRTKSCESCCHSSEKCDSCKISCLSESQTHIANKSNLKEDEVRPIDIVEKNDKSDNVNELENNIDSLVISDSESKIKSIFTCDTKLSHLNTCIYPIILSNSCESHSIFEKLMNFASIQEEKDKVIIEKIYSSTEKMYNSDIEEDNCSCLFTITSENHKTLSSKIRPRNRQWNDNSSLNDKKNYINSKGKENYKWHCPPRSIMKPALEAIAEFKMIQDKDKVLVCLSGGKDSLSLLHMLKQYQFYARKKGVGFELGAVTIDPLTPSYNPSPLKEYLKNLGVPYFYEEQCIMEMAQSASCNSICSFCSRMKRGRIYSCARREGFNIIALGQHLDDLAESFLMSTFHNGRLRTMKAHYTVQEADLRVIRPLIYVREKNLRCFAEQNYLPVIPENCPGCFEAPKERYRVKQLLAAQELLFPRLFWCLRTAMRPLYSIFDLEIEEHLGWITKGINRTSNT